MNDLTKLTAEELLDNKGGYSNARAEILRRLKRLENIEATLKPYAEHFGNAAVNRVARAALEAQ